VKDAEPQSRIVVMRCGSRTISATSFRLKLLFDHSLSHKIVAAFANLFERAHVRDFGLEREETDEEIRVFAKSTATRS
jgi:chromatin segregation and condensation protein Rec8/ScpA/Scc1 (kleisin family)